VSDTEVTAARFPVQEGCSALSAATPTPWPPRAAMSPPSRLATTNTNSPARRPHRYAGARTGGDRTIRQSTYLGSYTSMDEGFNPDTIVDNLRRHEIVVF